MSSFNFWFYTARKVFSSCVCSGICFWHLLSYVAWLWLVFLSFSLAASLTRSRMSFILYYKSSGHSRTIEIYLFFFLNIFYLEMRRRIGLWTFKNITTWQAVCVRACIRVWMTLAWHWLIEDVWTESQHVTQIKLKNSTDIPINYQVFL